MSWGEVVMEMVKEARDLKTMEAELYFWGMVTLGVVIILAFLGLVSITK